MDGKRIIEAVEVVTKKWARQRKAEERSASNAARRHHVFVRSARTTIKEAAWDVMPAAYLQASSNHTLPAHARQVMYAARGHVQRVTAEVLDDQYFTQTLLPDYLLKNPDSTADWDVVFDARGHFSEPHTAVIVALGTVDVRDYLRRIEGQDEGKKGRARRRSLFPTAGATNRFGAVLFIEKEGFLPLFRRVLLAERFDVAIMSTKGVSVTAARRLVDELSGQGIPCLALRDFDKAGFTIVNSLQADGRRYVFRHRPQVIDLGLRLEDVRQNHLIGEDVAYGESNPTANLHCNGATAEEIAYLCSGRRGNTYAGQRVEMNAFASGDLRGWIESKLEACGIKKVVPGKEILLEAYRRACEQQLLRRALRRLRPEVHETAKAVRLPDDIAKCVQDYLASQPNQPWDRAIEELAARGIEQD